MTTAKTRRTAFVPKTLVRKTLPSVIPAIALGLASASCNGQAVEMGVADVGFQADGVADLGFRNDTGNGTDVQSSDAADGPTWIALAVMAFDADDGGNG